MFIESFCSKQLHLKALASAKQNQNHMMLLYPSWFTLVNQCKYENTRYHGEKNHTMQTALRSFRFMILFELKHHFVLFAQWKIHINITRKWWLSFCFKLHLVILIEWMQNMLISVVFFSPKRWNDTKRNGINSINVCYVMQTIMGKTWNADGEIAQTSTIMLSEPNKRKCKWWTCQCK